MSLSSEKDVYFKKKCLMDDDHEKDPPQPGLKGG